VRHLLFKLRFIGLIALAMVGGGWPVGAQAAGSLGTEAGFAVLASGTGLTCTDTTVAGPVGISPSSTAVTKTRCHMQVQVADGAYADFLHDYSTMGGGFTGCTLLTGTLAGISLGPGTYCFDAAAALTGTLTLTGSGPWVFGIGTGAVGALTATSFTVVSGNPCNAFWWVDADVTLTTSAFQGTILGGGDITTTDTSLEGRLLATGAVTMTRTNIFGCTAAGTVTTSTKHCNQGVGNGPEGCDPGNSNQGDPSRSNDELGGTPGNPGRKGGNGKSDVQAASVSSVNTQANAAVATKSDSQVNSGAAVGVAAKSNSHASGNHDAAAKSKGDLHANGKSKSK